MRHGLSRRMTGSGPCPMGDDVVQSLIDFEDIDPCFAQKAEKRLPDAPLDQRADLISVQSACLGHPFHLEKGRIGADIRVQPRCGGGHQVGG